MGDRHALLWMLLLATLIWCAWWHTRENRQLARQWKKNLNEQSARGLVQFAWSRTAQLLAALAICTGIIMVYDWQLTEADNTIARLSKPNTEAAVKPLNPPERKPIPGNIALPPQAPAVAAQPATPTYYPPAATQAQIAQMPKAASNTANAADDDDAMDDESTDIDDEAENTANEPAAQEPAAQEQAANNAAASTAQVMPPRSTMVEDVYNPEANATDKQAALDKIKNRYEDILVTYLYLNKCNKADNADYRVILNALGRDLVEAHAPGDMRNEVLTASQGSYQEVYANQACDPGTITPLFAQYTDYILSLTPSQPVPAQPPAAQPTPVTAPAQ